MAGHACMWLWNQHPVRGGRSATEFLTPFRELVPVFQRRISLSVSIVALRPNHCSDSNSISYRTRQECSAYADHDFGGRDEVL